VTDKPSPKDHESTVPVPASVAERIVIRDKRKVGKPSDSASPEAAPEAAAVEAEAADEQAKTGEAQTIDGELIEAGEAHDVPVEVPEADTEPVPDSAQIGELRSTLDERTADLQRVTAEYANYRKRVERDRTLAAESAVAMVLAAMLPLLDDIDRARDHGDLTGPFASVAEQLGTITGKLGLTAFGAKGDPFDPKRHEAVAHQTSAEVSEPTCIDVMRRGYLLGDRLLRPAMVAVADPE
jgi:molecular chaperone GrpE